ncbi:protein titan9, partial [Trifolium pratense]
GYSFSISWISKAPGEEAELLYHVQSLGTLERLAPEWMREDIMFSPTMCPIFFERVDALINAIELDTFCILLKTTAQILSKDAKGTIPS